MTPATTSTPSATSDAWRDILRSMMALSLPVLAEEALNMLVGYTDWILTARFLAGDEPLAAMTLMAYLLWLLPGMFSIVSIGAHALVARLVGNKQNDDASFVVAQSLLLGLFSAVVTMLLMGLGGAMLTSAMQSNVEVQTLANRYLWILLPVVPMVMLEQVGSACLRAAGDTVSGMVARVILNITNLVVSFLLVTGYGPFPKLGWDGLAIGTATGHFLGGAIILLMLLRGRSHIRLKWERPRIDLAVLTRLVRVGIPGGADMLAIISCHMVYVAIIGKLGTVAQAAHGLGVQIEAMSYLPGHAFQAAAATLAGQAIGAGDLRRATRSALAAAITAVIVMSLAGLVFATQGLAIAAMFTGSWESDTVLLTAQLLKIVAVSCPFLAVLMIFSGALRGSGDTRWLLVITLVGLVGVRLPLAALLAWDSVPIGSFVIGGFGYGVAGAWWAMVIDVVVRCGVISYRFFQGGWRLVKV